MPVPNDRVYSESHEWHKLEGDTLTLGLTQFAVDQLTDVTFAEMREPGTTVEPGDVVGEVESVKTTSDIYCAVAGEIVEVNSKLGEDPGVLNSDPFGEGWLLKLKVTDKSGLDTCVDAATYEKNHQH
ncbi:MAG: glycine cleavage system protein GcvH [Phycisphaerales bacterium]|nr:MAG: glycine cleavage system protein GcvH [Phycisphaerales bacterium]